MLRQRRQNSSANISLSTGQLGGVAEHFLKKAIIREKVREKVKARFAASLYL